jgi:CcmD family protein
MHDSVMQSNRPWNLGSGLQTESVSNMQNSPPAASSTTVATGLSDRASEFHAVQGGTELHSGGLLLVEAYAAIWLILFAFVWLTYRRQRSLEQRIAKLEEALHKARREPT